jgi:hypothetical protein
MTESAMRRTLCHLAAIILLAGLVQGCANGPKQAAPNAGIAAVAAAADKAATDFVALAAPARTSGQEPRETDPAVKQLLDSVLDTSVLRRETATGADLKAIAEWAHAIERVTGEYILAGTGLTGALDVGQIDRSPTLSARSNQNAGRFAPELGRAFDASIILSRTSGDLLLSVRQSNPAVFQKPEVQQLMATVQRGTYAQFRASLIVLGLPAVTDDWRRARLVPLAEFAPTTAKLVPGADGGTLRQLAIDAAQCQGNQDVRARLLSIASSFPDYSADEAPAIRAAHTRLVQASCAARAAAAQLWALTRPNVGSSRAPRLSDPTEKALLDKILNTEAAEGDFPRYDDILPLDTWRVAVAQVYLTYILVGLDHATLGTLEQMPQDNRVLAKVAQNAVQYGPEFGRSVDAQLHLMQAMAEVFAARLGDDPRKFTEDQRNTFEAFRTMYGKGVLLMLQVSLQPIHGDGWRTERLAAFEAAVRRAPAILKADDATALHNFVAEAAKTEKNPQIRARLTRLAGSFAL